MDPSDAISLTQQAITTSLLLGCGALAMLILGKKLLPNKPVALFVVIAGIVVASFVDLGALGA